MTETDWEDLMNSKSGFNLGNSKGGNTGKKYLNHRNLPNVIFTKEDEDRIKNYMDWFTSNRDRIFGLISAKCEFDEDILHTTFARTYNNVAYSGLEINDYASYFCRSYYTNYTLDRQQNNRFVDLFSDNNYNDRYSTDNTLQVEVAQFMKELLVVKIQKLVEETYPEDKAIILSTYYNKKMSPEGTTLIKIANQFGEKNHNIQVLVSSANTLIKKSLGEYMTLIHDLEEAAEGDDLDDILIKVCNMDVQINSFYESIKSKIQ